MPLPEPFCLPFLQELDEALLDYERHILGELACQDNIDKTYDKIVENLRSAAHCFVPQRQKKLLQILVESRARLPETSVC